jgi:hypothetical protein
MSLTPAQAKELSTFAALNANFPTLRVWLLEQRESAVTQMVKNMDIDMLRRAQGKIEFIDKMTDLLASAHTHLR